MKRTELKRKTPLRAKTGLKPRKPKRKKKSALQKRKDKMDSPYWNNKCKAAVAKYMHRQACFICGKMEPEVELVCGHHNIEKSMSRYHRWELLNIVPLCKDHHLNNQTCSPHQKHLPLAIEAYIAALEAKLPNYHSWWVFHEAERKHQKLTVGFVPHPDWRGQYEQWQKMIDALD
ncbi:MAG: hypothetical protein GY807_24805 [Gammaproteobacteria bacterium]|nr:hypothetical protein [Gammaproteobacteria bacterium]